MSSGRFVRFWNVSVHVRGLWFRGKVWECLVFGFCGFQAEVFRALGLRKVQG